jgi:voltage-gated potassium channel Kch
MPRHIWRSVVDLRCRLYEILEHGAIGDRTGLIVGRLIVVLIITNLVTMTLDSVPALRAQYGPLFLAIELLSLVVFTIEYGLRVWVAAEHAPHRHSSERKARWEFVSSPLGVIDLLAVLPFWFAFVLPGDLRVLLVFRMVRFLKLARYSPAMRSLLDALYSERRALFGCFVILLGATLLAASIMHVVEGHAQPDKFGTIPDAMWWAIVTLGTIGYGDVVPVTVLGRIVASVTIFVGLIMVALPIGIVLRPLPTRSTVATLSSLGGWSRACRCSPNFKQRISPTSCGCCARSRSRLETLSPSAASPLIPCISSRPEKWRSSSSTSAFGSAPVISSAKSRCCAGRVDPRPLPPSRELACSCSMPTICTSSWNGSPVSRSISVKWLAPDWAATSSRGRAILSLKSSRKPRRSNGRRVAMVVHDAKVNGRTGNKRGLPSEARA